MFVEAPATPIEDAIECAIQAAKQENNRALSGFASRLFHELPKLIVKSIHESQPHLRFDSEWLNQGCSATPKVKSRIHLNPTISVPTSSANAMSSLTRSEAHTLLHDAINHAVTAAKRDNNRAIAGFASRLFHELPKLVTKAVEESNPGLTINSQALTSSLQAAFAEFAGDSDRASATSVR
ncbi:hypothetical protein [Pantanalinema sp. GBBB05]|uniref:hypothetical protein n=1 Tax=Pantanalinema sp. GBBB05 TaxID=2604139 RepID=UPI001DAB9741|nr:hypothetical protein [Pantanalinema sp. GBBB05]